MPWECITYMEFNSMLALLRFVCTKEFNRLFKLLACTHERVTISLLGKCTSVTKPARWLFWLSS